MRLAIKGHLTRGKEVIEILEMLGGKNHFYYDGTYKDLIYTIDSTLELDIFNVNSPNIKDDYIVFTLEEFFEKYPYKVGDYVYINSNVYQGPGIIQNLYWCEDTNIIRYFVESNRCNAYWEANELLSQIEQETTEK